jgi:glycosyltransferase involved in cell wall biosynthesis
VCDANLAYLTHRLDGSGARLVRVYNGLGPQPAPTPMSRREPDLVLAVGRLVEKKGFDLLLDAVAQLHRDRPGLRCVIVGDGEERAALATKAMSLGIADIVTFTGAVGQDAVAEWLRKAQVMVAPCRVGDDGNQDALPTVLIEALAAGLPAVTTPVAGIPEIITHGVEGLVVECGNVPRLAASIAQLLDDPEALRRMSEAGPAKLADRFDRTATIQELIGTFRSRELVR